MRAVALAVALALAGLASASPTARPSPDGTSIIAPTNSTLVDAASNVWTIVNGVAYKGGVAAGNTYNVSVLLLCKGVIYQENTSKAWYDYVNVTTGYWPAVAGSPAATCPLAPPAPPPAPALPNFSCVLTLSTTPATLACTEVSTT